MNNIYLVIRRKNVLYEAKYKNTCFKLFLYSASEVEKRGRNVVCERSASRDIALYIDTKHAKTHKHHITHARTEIFKHFFNNYP